MHYRKLYNSNYIASYDLDGKDTVLTIETVQKTPVFNPKKGHEEEVPVVTFKEAKKGWILNKTNGDSIADLHGKEIEDWIGKQITLQVVKVKHGKEITDGIRVKKPEKTLKK